MIELWQRFKPQIIFSILIASLFITALKIEPLVKGPFGSIVQIPETDAVPQPTDVPDFAAILDVELKKQAFFAYIQPYIDQENDEILEMREAVGRIQEKLSAGRNISSRDSRLLNTLSVRYELESVEIESQEHLRELLKRLDVIPASLVLAQAANESAWGTSRFARYGYNFFGQWCYREGCGFVPSRRSAGDIHEVKRFSSVKESVHAYFMNLNTFQSYESLRLIRQKLRDNGQIIDGISLTEGLESYSERGEEYIWELQSMMHSNGLTELDDA